MPHSHTVGYRFLADNVFRPYLAVNVVGPNGISRVVFGIVDSGADMSCFPMGYINEFGYDATQLTEQPMGQAGGVARSFVSTVASTAVVPEFPNDPVLIRPTFTEGQWVLWGRSDFMNVFTVTFLEPQKQFVLTVP